MSPLLWGLVGFAVSVPLVLLGLLVTGLCRAAGRKPQNAATAPGHYTRGQSRTSFDQHADEAIALTIEWSKPPEMRAVAWADVSDFQQWERENGWVR